MGVTFKFTRNGESILLDGSLFGITNYSGIESSDYNLVTAENVNADGERIRRRHVLPREIMVDFDYLSWEYIPSMRQKLIGFFSPYSGGTLKINYMGTVRDIEYEVESFKMNNINIHDELSCLLYVKCLDPSFKESKISLPITTLIGGWEWKFSLPFSLRQYGELKKIITNEGHMETPVEIYFKGPAASPKVTNTTTGESILVNRELTENETLYINTAFRNKKVQIINNDGTIEDAWNYLDKTVTDFFWLQEGDNAIEYSTSTIASTTGVVIEYKERFLGV